MRREFKLAGFQPYLHPPPTDLSYDTDKHDNPIDDDVSQKASNSFGPKFSIAATSRSFETKLI
jgi:hypothetical protein